MALCGLSRRDLWLRDDFCDDCTAELMRLAAYCTDVGAVVGYPHREGRTRYNAAALLAGGRIEAFYFKQKLPNYAVFDERRYFEPGNRPCVFEVEGRKVAITICEDLWFPSPGLQAKAAGAGAPVSINASPFHRAQQAERYTKMGARVKERACRFSTCTAWAAGRDRLRRRVLRARQRGHAHLPGRELPRGDRHRRIRGRIHRRDARSAPTEEELHLPRAHAGTADYVNKNRFPGVLLGLSGGVGLGAGPRDLRRRPRARAGHAVMMPSDYTASISIEDAREMARIHGVEYSEIAIEPMFDAFREQLAARLRGPPGGHHRGEPAVAIRGTLLMALSNKSGSIVIATGNKSEMATGYATLYGDMAGGFAVLKDIVKTQVYRLANWRNARPAW
jgi:hypothetical protein